MAFDECAEPHEREYSEDAMHRTHRWLERCVRSKAATRPGPFRDRSGRIFPDLRKPVCRIHRKPGTPGSAIGGLSVGESKTEMHAMIEVVNQILPAGKAQVSDGSRVTRGSDQWHLAGVDIFDCVLPTRLARHHAAFTPTGRINLANDINASDKSPIDESCWCYACRNFSRAYIRHLSWQKRCLQPHWYPSIISYFLLAITRQARQAILESRYDRFAQEFLTPMARNMHRKRSE